MRTSLDRSASIALVTAAAGFSPARPALGHPRLAALPRTASAQPKLNGIEQRSLA
jgi:hypothetical protein